MFKQLQTEASAAANGDRGQLGVFMALVMGAIALLVVSIVLLLGLQIAGGFADSGTAETEAFTADVAGEYVHEVERTAADEDVHSLGDSVTVVDLTTDETLDAEGDYDWDAGAGELTILDAGDGDEYEVTYSVFDGQYAGASQSTTDSTGDAFELFGTSVLVIPAAAVLAVLIGGLVGAIQMRNGMPGTGGNGAQRRR